MPLYCPYCLSQQAFNNLKCGKCQKDVPRDYIQYSRKYPPVWLVTFGFPGHGKTNLINSLTLHIENVDKISPGAFYDYLDTRTTELVDEIRLTIKEANVNIEPTPQTDELPPPLLISIDGFPPERINTLVIYDLAGEATITPKEDYVRAIQHARTAWFVVSLTDLQGSESRSDNQPRNINNLFMTYRNVMESLNVPLKGRSIVVNYTKGDLLLEPQSQFNLPQEVIDYFMDDPYFDLAHMSSGTFSIFDENNYQKKMSEISTLLREFTRREVPGGASFINQVERKYGMNIDFCITSATGGKGGAVDIDSYRILDPLLWAIHLNDQVVDETINATIIIDPQFNFSDLPTTLFNIFSTYGANVTTFNIGEKRPVVEPGQPPITRPSNARIPLIGPILDSLDTQNSTGQDLVLLCLEDQTPIDLYDFKYTRWENQLHIITSQRETAEGWFNRTLVESSNPDLGLIVDGLIDRLGQQK